LLKDTLGVLAGNTEVEKMHVRTKMIKKIIR